MKSFANKPIGSSKVTKFIFTIFLSDSGIGETFESFKNVHKHRRCGRFSFKEVCRTYSFAVHIVLHATPAALGDHQPIAISKMMAHYPFDIDSPYGELFAPPPLISSLDARVSGLQITRPGYLYPAYAGI